MATSKISKKGSAAKATATKKNGAKAKPTGGAGAAAAILAEVAAHLAAARASLGKLDLETLMAAQRKDSIGRLRHGEDAAMTNILDTVDAFPEVFVSLADKDGGVDDAKVETAPARAHLARWTAVAPLVADLDAMSTQLTDALLVSAEGAKDVTIPAYGIIRANAPANAKLAKKAKPAIKFYGRPAVVRAQNVKKAARAAAKKKAPSSAE